MDGEPPSFDPARPFRRAQFRSALLIHPEGACVSHLSAAATHGLPVPERPFVHVTVVRAKDRRFRPEIKPHVREADVRIVLVRGMPVSDVISTFIECAGMLGLVDLVILGDAIVRRFHLTGAQLLAACRNNGAYYAKLAAAGALMVRDGVDSPMETRLRLLIVLAGLPEPEVNVEVRDVDGYVLRHPEQTLQRVRRQLILRGWGDVPPIDVRWREHCAA